MKLCLRVVSGLQVGDQTWLAPPGGTVGRSEGCALQLRDESVSRAHAELRFHQDGWWVYQRSTRSPTLVDGRPAVGAPIELREHGVLQLGGVALEYERELDDPAVAELQSPPTMINVRYQLPAIQHLVLPQMTPIRAAELAPAEVPATMIMRAVKPDFAEVPATMIMRRPAAVPPPPPEDALATHVRPAELTPPKPTAVPPPGDPVAARRLAQLEKEHDELRRERAQLQAEVERLTRDNTQLRDSQAALNRQLEVAARAAVGPPAPAAVSAAVKAEALHLLAPFAESLEAASEALKAGDAAGARELVREASFGLADLRDLFESN